MLSPSKHRSPLNAAEKDSSSTGSGRTEEGFADAARRLAGQAGVLLGWPPATFWAATPDELAAVLAALAGDAPPCASPSDLSRLMEMFPDG